MCVLISRAERSGPSRRATPPPTGVACHVVGAGDGASARPSPLARTSREPLTRVVKHAGPRESVDAGRSVSPEAPGCLSKRESAPPPRREAGRSMLPAPGPGCGDLSPQRTTSRELYLILILPIPPHTDDRPRTAAESTTAVRTAEPAHRGRRDNPTDVQPRRMHRTRLRRDPERARRRDGHGRRMRHPEGGGEGGGHRWFSLLRRSVVRASLWPVAGREFRANENGRRVRSPRFRGDSVSQTISPWGTRCCADGMGRDSRFVRQW